MLRVIMIALIALLLAATAVDARTRIRVQKDITLRKNPYAIEFVLSAMLCHFAVMATPPGNPLPPCATPRAAPTRRV